MTRIAATGTSVPEAVSAETIYTTVPDGDGQVSINLVTAQSLLYSPQWRERGDGEVRGDHHRGDTAGDERRRPSVCHFWIGTATVVVTGNISRRGIYVLQ